MPDTRRWQRDATQPPDVLPPRAAVESVSVMLLDTRRQHDTRRPPVQESLDAGRFRPTRTGAAQGARRRSPSTGRDPESRRTLLPKGKVG